LISLIKRMVDRHW